LNPQVFQTPIEYLKGVGTARAEVLKKDLGIFKYEDLLRHFPFKYIDRTRFYKIRDINPELPHVQVIARLTHKEILGEKQTSYCTCTRRYRRYGAGLVSGH
jgi:ATP-dependent DNA helicase RecG